MEGLDGSAERYALVRLSLHALAALRVDLIVPYSEGGIFELELVFPPDFPMSPPTLRFISEFWHPNGSPFLISDSSSRY